MDIEDLTDEQVEAALEWCDAVDQWTLGTVWRALAWFWWPWC